MDLLITGATGFLGSHLAVQWLLRHPGARVGGLVRAADDGAASARLHTALGVAAADGGVPAGDLPARAEAIRGDMDEGAGDGDGGGEEAGWIGRARSWLRGPTQLVHCAANLSFREADRAAVWRTNVDGTAALLRALPALPGLVGFNHVSTAYVAGSRRGTILEDEADRPDRFNNPYEESKWTAEAQVRAGCAAAGLPWRVLRPSIIVAHSVTHRMSSHSGFYQVIDTLLQLGRKAGMAGRSSVALPVTEGTTLDLIPVDLVVRDILALIEAGPATANRTFHVTAADPLRLADVLQELSPMSGVALQADEAAGTSGESALIMRRLRHYMPYFGVRRRFDQANLRACLGPERFRMDIETLRGFVWSYMDQVAAARSAADQTSADRLAPG